LEDTAAALKTTPYLKWYSNVIVHDPEEVGRQPKGCLPCPFSQQSNGFDAINWRLVASSRDDASFAVVLNCGIGSSSLKALVNALDKLHTVRGANSAIRGLTPGQVFRGVELALYEGLVDHQSRCIVRQAHPLPRLDLFPHRFEVPLHAVHSHREDVHEAQVLGVLGEHGREHA